MFIGFKNLWQEKTRLAVSVGGISAAILLTLVLDGVFAGTARQVTVFISESKADVWVMQSGVSNMHMATTIMPESKVREVKAVDGVKEVSAIGYGAAGIKMGREKQFTYLIGFDPVSRLGGPWKLAAGRVKIGNDEVVIDETAAARRGIILGDKVKILGKDFTVAGLSADTFSIANTSSFVTRDALEKATGNQGKINYILVTTDENAGKTAARIKDKVAGVNAITSERLVANDQRMIMQMGVDVINAMAFFGFLIGVAVTGLTIYTLTLERTREFAIIKAVGANRRQLLRIVFEQSISSVGLGLVAGFLLALGARQLIERFLPSLSIVYRPELFGKMVMAMLVISLIASYLPIRRVFKIDPMTAFKK